MRAPFRLSPATALVLVAAAAFLAGVTSLGNGFAYDDEEVVAGNPRVTDPSRLGEIWTTSYWGPGDSGGLYRPLTTLSFALNHRAGGLAPFGYHLVNVLLHVAVALLLLLLAAELLPLPAALAGALLFAVHPVHTEAVANVVGRAELLAALGFFGAWLIHGRGAAAAGPAHAGAAAPAGASVNRRPGASAAWGCRVAAALLFGLGVFSKEVAAVLPAALLARDLFQRRRPDLPGYALYVAVLGAYFGLRHHVLGGFAGIPGVGVLRTDNVIATLSFLPGLWTALAVFGRYLALLLVPWRLSADYSWPEITPAGAGESRAWLGLLALIAMMVLVIVAWRRTRVAERPEAGVARGPAGWWAAFGIGLALFGITFAPVSNFLLRIGTVMGERLLYLPSAGFLLAAAALWERARRGLGPAGRRGLVAATALLVLAGAGRSAVRNRDWRSTAAIHAATARTSPRSARARFNNGVSLHDAGRPAEAIAEMQRSVELDPTDAEAWTSLGGYKLSLGRMEEALADLSRALSIDSGAAGAWFNVGLARAALGDTAAAIDAYRRCLLSDPRNAGARANLAWCLLATGGSLSEALANATSAVELLPDADAFDTLARVLGRLGRADEARQARGRALAWLEAAAAREPGRADTWYNLALARIALADTAGAIQAWRRSLELGRDQAGAHNDLAWYLALTGGPLDEALRHAERAVALDPAGGNYDTLAEVLYRMGRIDAARQAWRQALARGAGNAAEIHRKVGGL